MNNVIKSRLTRPVISIFVIGLIVGGFAMGILDNHRPQPFFSKADVVSEVPIECVGPAQQALNYFTWANSQTRPVRPDIYAGWQQEWENIYNNLANCITSICDPIYQTFQTADNAWEEAKLDERVARAAANTAEHNAEVAYGQYETASQAYDDAHTAYTNYRDSLVPPISASQQNQLNQLLAAQTEALQASNAAEEHYNDLYEVSEQANQDLEEAVQEVGRTELVRDQAYQAYQGSHCESAQAIQFEELEPNTEPGYEPTPTPPAYNPDPYNQQPGYNQPPTNTPTPTPGRPKDDGVGTSAGIKSLIPQLPSSDKTRAY